MRVNVKIKNTGTRALSLAGLSIPINHKFRVKQPNGESMTAPPSSFAVRCVGGYVDPSGSTAEPPDSHFASCRGSGAVSVALTPMGTLLTFAGGQLCAGCSFVSATGSRGDARPNAKPALFTLHHASYFGLGPTAESVSPGHPSCRPTLDPAAAVAAGRVSLPVTTDDPKCAPWAPGAACPPQSGVTATLAVAAINGTGDPGHPVLAQTLLFDLAVRNTGPAEAPLAGLTFGVRFGRGVLIREYDYNNAAVNELVVAAPSEFRVACLGASIVTPGAPTSPVAAPDACRFISAAVSASGPGLTIAFLGGMPPLCAGCVLRGRAGGPMIGVTHDEYAAQVTASPAGNLELESAAPTCDPAAPPPACRPADSDGA